MDDPLVDNFDNLCFVCLKNSENLVDLNDDEKSADVLQTLFGLEIQLEGIAKNICLACREQFNSFVQFYELLKTNLERLMSKTEIKEERFEVVNLPDRGSDISESDNEQFGGKRPRLVKVPAKTIEEAIASYKKLLNENSNCLICDFVGINNRNLSLHMKHRHHDKRDRWCSRCNSFVDDLKSHSNSHSKNIYCDFCRRNVSRSHFVVHLKAHADLEYKCNDCSKKFISQESLDVHSAVHRNAKPFECPNCSRQFWKAEGFEDHMKMHGRYTCKICDKHFEIPEMLTVHLCCPDTPGLNDTKTKKIEDLSCHFCQKSYTTTYKLQMHIKGHLGEYPFQCGECGRGFVRKADCLGHERTHLNEKSFICNVCGKGLSSAATLRVHLKQHTGRPEKCDICQKTFCRKSELRLHLQKHRGERPFLCTECGMSFTQGSHLTSHLTMHSDARPFKCTECDKTFKKKELLKHHSKLHGEKRFKCSVCSYECHKNYRLRQHMKMHDGKTDSKTNICQLCNRGFSSLNLLNGHMANAHNVIL